MSWFNHLCAWIAIVAIAGFVVTLMILIWTMPIITMAKIALTSIVAAVVFGILATMPMW
jgi:hypothetical protein